MLFEKIILLERRTIKEQQYIISKPNFPFRQTLIIFIIPFLKRFINFNKNEKYVIIHQKG